MKNHIYNRLAIAIVSCLALTACHTPFAESNAPPPALPGFTQSIVAQAVLTAYQTTTQPDLAACDAHLLGQDDDATPNTTSYQLFCRNKAGETVVRSGADVTPDFQSTSPVPATAGLCLPSRATPAGQVINITQSCNYNGKPVNFAIMVYDQEIGDQIK